MTVHARPAAIASVEADTGQPPLSTLTLAIDNMHCGGCLRAVERAAQGVQGVQSARANLSAKRVSIAYDPTRASEVDLIAALAATGFAAAPMQAAKPATATRRSRALCRARSAPSFTASPWRASPP
jgi:Cu2+-exporting ATPase